VLGVFDHDLHAWKGVMQSYYVDEKLRDGILVEATYPPPGVGYSAGGVGGKGRDLKDFLARYKQTAAAGLIISDSGTGRVRALPGGGMLLTYNLSADDLRKTLEGIRLTTEIYLAAGAQEVHTLLQRPAPRGRDQLDSQRDAGKRSLRGVLEGGRGGPVDVCECFRAARQPELQVRHFGVVAVAAAGAGVVIGDPDQVFDARLDRHRKSAFAQPCRRLPPIG
jgi:hypothetical protein